MKDSTRKEFNYALSLQRDWEARKKSLNQAQMDEREASNDFFSQVLHLFRRGDYHDIFDDQVESGWLTFHLMNHCNISLTEIKAYEEAYQFKKAKEREANDQANNDAN